VVDPVGVIAKQRSIKGIAGGLIAHVGGEDGGDGSGGEEVVP
jgi:hypothetical protein